jgi:N-acetylglucosamine-6-phosphate deacetylase
MPDQGVGQEYLLTGAKLYTPDLVGLGSVLISDAKIGALYRLGETLPSGIPAIDLGGAALGPGFIDLHVHGADGVELMAGGEDVLPRIARFLAHHGVTSFLPTTVAADWLATEKAIERTRRAWTGSSDGARVLGLHLEGPFLSPERLGAQSPAHCILPGEEKVRHVVTLLDGLPCIVTLAPELPGGMEAIRAFASSGAIVSLGHSAATAEQAAAAFAAGASMVTHGFNAMTPMHHRRPGMIGEALATEGVRVELIADGVHLHPTTVRLAVAAKGSDGVILVSDAMAATGCADGEYVLGPVEVSVREGIARLKSGALAGSTLTLERAVVNVARWTGALDAAWQMASLNPARQLGVDDRLGRLSPGYEADLVALDASGKVLLTLVAGRSVAGDVLGVTR